MIYLLIMLAVKSKKRTVHILIFLFFLNMAIGCGNKKSSQFSTETYPIAELTYNKLNDTGKELSLHGQALAKSIKTASSKETAGTCGLLFRYIIPIENMLFGLRQMITMERAHAKKGEFNTDATNAKRQYIGYFFQRAKIIQQITKNIQSNSKDQTTIDFAYDTQSIIEDTMRLLIVISNELPKTKIKRRVKTTSSKTDLPTVNTKEKQQTEFSSFESEKE